MIAWWIHLSFSHGMIVLILAVFALCLLGHFAGRFIRFGMAAEPSQGLPQDPWPIRDYSAERQEKIDWLGPEHLLATPVNRIGKGAV